MPLLLTQNESINWLLNIAVAIFPPCRWSVRLPFYTAMPRSIRLLTLPADSQFSAHVGNDVSVHPAGKLSDVLQRLGEDALKVWLDSTSCNAACGLQLLQHGAHLLEQTDLACWRKPVKMTLS